MAGLGVLHRGRHDTFQTGPDFGCKSMKRLRLAATAFRSEFGDPEANLSGILAWMDRAAERKAHLVCFPETALQGYCTVPDVIRRLAEPIDGPRFRAIADKAAALGLWVSIGMALREGGEIYNSQVFIGPDGFVGAQYKAHLCCADHTYTPGDSWQVFEVAGWRVGATICFDSEFPEAARVLALKGADLVLMSFACGRRDSKGAPAQPGDWAGEIRRWAPSRAFDNRIFVVGFNHAGVVADANGHAVANPHGLDGIEEWAPPGTDHRWPGYGFALDPGGNFIAESNRADHESKLLIVDLDPALLETWRAPIDVKGPRGMVRGDFLAVRRIDTFGDLLEPDRRPP